jgi:hypothetical protein
LTTAVDAKFGGARKIEAADLDLLGTRAFWSVVAARGKLGRFLAGGIQA